MPYHVNRPEYFRVRHTIHISIHGEVCDVLHFPLLVTPHFGTETYLDFRIGREDFVFFEELDKGFGRVD